MTLQGNDSPRLSRRSANEEWNTPADVLAFVQAVLGQIDLDPASSHHAQITVGAQMYFTKEQNSLDKPWLGRVFLNPPYTRGVVELFAEKLVHEYSVARRVTEAIWLCNNSTDTAWFHTLASHAGAILFPRGRIGYYGTDASGAATRGKPLQGQAIMYFGSRATTFVAEARLHKSVSGYVALPAGGILEGQCESS